ncbi:MAG: hypothetical protein KDK45_18995, partial [Leptospiraceae bacterium]|nr:hypothetical protein [Leptospiraceae bacterium]
MAKSYYRIIDGIKYDRGLLDEAEKFQSENPQKKITVQKAKEFIESAGDGNIVTEVEKASLAYIAEHYPVSPQAKILLLEASKADKEKPKAKAAKKKAGAKKKAAKKKEKTSSTSPKLVPVDFPSAVKEEPDSDFSTEEPEDRLPPPAEEPKTEVLKAENLEQEMKVSEAEKKMEDLFPSFSDRLRKIEEDREVTRSKPEPLFKAPPKEVVKEPVEPPVTRKTELPPTAPRTPIIQKEEEKEEKKSGLLRLIILGLIV